MEVGRIAGQNNDAAGWIRFDLVAVELIPQADVEDARHDGVDSVLRVFVRHELHARGHFDPDHVRSRLSGLSNKHGQSGRRRERRERLPVDVFRQDRSENGLAWLVRSRHCGPPYLDVLHRGSQLAPQINLASNVIAALRTAPLDEPRCRNTRR